jgi:hypothetical protein
MLTHAVTQSEDINEQAEAFHAQITPDPQIVRYLISRCEDIGEKRVLFVIADCFVGTGNSDIARDDHLSLISGTPMPLLQRDIDEEGNKYQTVSSCFVAGLMDGELWDEDALEEMVFV